MKIDRVYLEATLANLRQQEQEGRTLAERARGAIMLCEALLARDQEPEAVHPSPASVSSTDSAAGRSEA